MNIEITEQERDVLLFAMQMLREKDEEHYRYVISKNCNESTLKAYKESVVIDSNLICRLKELK